MSAAVYVYGVVRAEARPRLAATGIEGGASGRVEHGALAAVVGEAPAGDVRASRRNLLAHSAVLQEVVDGRCDVLPMRFGTVLPDADAVRDGLLAAHADSLLAELEALTGLVELDITVSCPNDELVQALVAGDAALADAARRLRDGSYHERLELGERIAGAVNGARDQATHRLLGAVRGLAAACDVGEPAHEDMLANVAFLVARSGLEAFDAAVEELGARLRAPMRARCVGPLAPYRFADVPLAEETGAWA
jgi:hypothetical protein